MMTQARYLSHDLTDAHHLGTGPTCVLVHGLYATAGVWKPLRDNLEQQLHSSTHTLSYFPGTGVAEISERVAKMIEGIKSQAPIHLLGHSLGGLVVRHYASGPRCDPRVVQTISLAAPFLGAKRPSLVPGAAAIDIGGDSPLLRQLRENSEKNTRVPHLTILAEEDTMIVSGAYPDFGNRALIRCTGHNGILFHPETSTRVIEAIDAIPLQA